MTVGNKKMGRVCEDNASPNRCTRLAHDFDANFPRWDIQGVPRETVAIFPQTICYREKCFEWNLRYFEGGGLFQDHFQFLTLPRFRDLFFFFLNKFNFFNRFKFSSQSCSWRQDEFSDLDNYKIGVPIRDHSKLIFVEHPEIISDLWCSKWWPWGVNTLIYSGPKRQLHALQCLKIAFGQLHTGHPVYLLCSFSRSSSHEAREIGN